MNVIEDRARSIFFGVLDRAPDEWPAILADACGNDSELQARVEQLILAHRAIGSISGADASGQIATAEEQPISERPGTTIGPYKLLEQIGEGGFGVVFMAEQMQPMRRKVALKVLKPGMDTRRVVARFEAERQALALMDHPNIARVLDGGETPSGRPYFVMELVRGIPITDFCDQNCLPIRERLELFVNVCQAVQDAHQKGIIHRDLKPTNIMVTLHDDKAVVKVIDFGVAKAMGQQLTDKTLFTNFAQMIGTPVYMSPEQAQMSGLDMDTRTDIYSLGVLLYELLTGTTPFDKRRLGTAAYDEVRRIIQEEDPPKPSTRLSELARRATQPLSGGGVADRDPGPSLDSIAAHRHAEPARLGGLVRGDLDWIVMKALEKDRNRRYASAHDLAIDVQRHLSDQTVLACPPNVAYRLRKFTRRHRGPVMAASLVLLALVSGVITTTWQMLRAVYAESQARDEASQRASALVEREAALVASRQSEQEARDKLFLALLNQARAQRSSGRVGQRFEALNTIRQAAEIRKTPELRTEAIAALALPDVEIAHEWEGWPQDTIGVACDATFKSYARLSQQALTLYQLHDGREEITYRLPIHHAGRLDGPRMSDDGRFVAYAHSWQRVHVLGGVTLWKLDGPAPTLVPLEEPTSLHEAAWAFHPNSRRMAIGHADSSVSVYDLATGRRLHRLSVTRSPLGLSFHPREDRLAVASGNVVQIFDTDTGKELAVLKHPAPVTQTEGVAWHPDGRRLAVGCNDLKIRVWDTETATEIMSPWTGHTNSGLVLAFSRSGDRLVSSDWDNQTRVWDSVNGQPLLTIAGSAGMQFDLDDRFLGIGRSGTRLRLWRLASNSEPRIFRRSSGGSLESSRAHHRPVVHADGRTLAASTGEYLSFFDLTSGAELASMRQSSEWTAHPAFFEPARAPRAHEKSSDENSGGWVTTGSSGLLFWPARFDAARPGLLRVGPPEQLAADLKSPAQACVSRDGRVIAVPQRNSTIVLHRDRPDHRVVLAPQFDARYVAVSPDGRTVVTGNHWEDGHSRGVQIWDAESGDLVHELPLVSPTTVRLSHDGRWLATVNALGTQLWEVGTWREMHRFEHGQMAFAPDGRLFAISDVFSAIRLIEIGTGREVARLTGPELMSYSPACFTPDGTRLIATCSGLKALYVWDLRSIRQQLKQLDLDWDWPEFVSQDAANQGLPPLSVEIVHGDSDHGPLTHEQRTRRDIERYRRALETNPEDALSCNNLAWAYITAPESLRETDAAVSLAETAVRIEPGNPFFANTLGGAYYRAGRYREALETLQPNLERQEDWALAFDLYFLAMSHYRLGEASRARDFYEWAVRWPRTYAGLSAEQLEELDMLRAEAEALFGAKGKKD